MNNKRKIQTITLEAIRHAFELMLDGPDTDMWFFIHQDLKTIRQNVLEAL